MKHPPLGQARGISLLAICGYDACMTDSAQTPAAETPPDRLCVDPSSPFHDEALLARGIGVRFKGVEKTNVEEYCVSGGWVRVVAGAALDRKGQPMTMLLKGTVEPYLETPPAE